MIARTLAAAGLVWLALGLSARAADTPQQLEIDTATGAHLYQVEIADDEATRERGLMNRKQMAPDHGMLFEFEHRGPVTFWMKDTYISLDMIFIDVDGTVRGVFPRAKPLSEMLIPSGANVIAVLELNAGQAAAIRLHTGDKVKFPFFH